MKNVLTLVLASVLMLTGFSCKEKSNQPAVHNVAVSAGVTVYYFHFTRRCATCNAVESTTRSTLETHFAKQLTSGALRFESVNLEESKNQELAEKLGADGQSLIVTKDNNRTDLTSIAFLNAVQHPEKLQQTLITTLQPLLDH